MLPCASPSTWISMWRGSSMYFSRNIAVVAKARPRLARRALEALAQLAVVVGDAHALAAAAGRRLDHHRIADLARDRDRRLGVRDHVEVAGHGRDAGRARRVSSTAILSPIAAIAAGVGPMKTMPASASAVGEAGLLRQKAVAGMHRLGAGRAGRPRRCGRSADSSRPPAPARSAPPRRPCARAAPRHRPRNRPRPSRSPSAAPCGSPGRRSRRDWRSGSS